MTKIDKSNSFDDSENKNSSLTLLNILEDVVATLSESKYSDSFVIKGGMSLMSAVSSSSDLIPMRMTSDIDLHWRDRGLWVEAIDNLEEILTANSQLGIKYTLVSRRGFVKNPDGDSVKLKAVAENGIEFNLSLDMNLSNFNVSTSKYNSPTMNISFNGYSLEAMLADKLYVIATEKIYRRVKDLYDIYLISTISDFNLGYLVDEIRAKWLSQNKILHTVFLTNGCDLNQLQHAYNKMYNVTDKPEFQLVVSKVLNFSIPIYDRLIGSSKLNLNWNCKESRWGK